MNHSMLLIFSDFDQIIGSMGSMIASTLKLGIALLNGGNAAVQQVK